MTDRTLGQVVDENIDNSLPSHRKTLDSVKPTINIQINQPSPVEQLERAIAADPCGTLGHQPAYLTGGGIACYRCGARYS